ncbi:MAG: hemolysin family protein [bacterium]
MGGIGWKLLATALFVFLNGFFVTAEFALVKVRVSRVQAIAASGSRRAKLVAHLLENMNLYLSACQLGITLASLILGWLAEPAVAAGLKALVAAAGFEIHAGVLHIVSLALALTIVTLLHMVLGEQVPKIWAIQRAERTSLAIAYPLRFFAAVFSPLIWVVNSLSNGMLRLLGVNPHAAHDGVPDASEIRSILASSASAGHITIRQREFAQNILEFNDLEVRHVLVPRADIVWLSQRATREETLRTIRESGHSRFPLCDDGLDSVIGIVHSKALLVKMADDDNVDVTSLARTASFVPDTMPLSRLIVALQRSHSGCAVVVDEHGTVLGLVYLDDALEEIVGPIYDEFDDAEAAAEPMLTRLSEKAVEVSGAMSFPEARQLLQLVQESEADTIGGFVISLLKALPKKGDRLLIDPYCVTVLSVGGRRIRRLRFDPNTDQLNEPCKGIETPDSTADKPAAGAP